MSNEQKIGGWNEIIQIQSEARTALLKIREYKSGFSQIEASKFDYLIQMTWEEKFNVSALLDELYELSKAEDTLILSFLSLTVRLLKCEEIYKPQVSISEKYIPLLLNPDKDFPLETRTFFILKSVELISLSQKIISYSLPTSTIKLFWKFLVENFKRIRDRDPYLAELIKINLADLFSWLLKGTVITLISTETVSLFCEDVLNLINSYIEIFQTDTSKNIDMIRNIESLLGLYYPLFYQELSEEYEEVITFIYEKLLYSTIRLSNIDNIILQNLSYILAEGILSVYQWSRDNNNKWDKHVRILYGQIILKRLCLIADDQTYQNEKLEKNSFAEFIKRMFTMHYDCISRLFLFNDLMPGKRPIIQETLLKIIQIIKMGKFGEKCALNLNVILNMLLKPIGEERQEDLEALKILEDERVAWKSFGACINESENAKKTYQKIRAHFVEENLSDEELATRIAIFFFQDYNVNSSSLTKMLGGNENLSILVLQKYLAFFHFENCSIELALRSFFLTFLMKECAEMVERVLSGFSTHFYNHNKSTFPSEDIVFPYVYALIMLNTDLHNSYKTGNKKMTSEEFKVNTRRVLGASDISNQELEKIYFQIEKKEIKALDHRELTLEKEIDKRTWQFFCDIFKYNNFDILSVIRKKAVEAWHFASQNRLHIFNINSRMLLINQVMINLSLFINQLYGKDLSEVEALFEALMAGSINYGNNSNNGLSTSERELTSERLIQLIYNNLDIVTKFDLVIRDEKVMWRILCFFMAVKKAFIFKQFSLRLLVKMLIETYTFQKNILCDKILLNNYSFYEKMVQSSDKMNKFKHEKASIFAIFSGFLGNEFDSETSSKIVARPIEYTKIELEAQQNFLRKYKNIDLIENLLNDSKLMVPHNSEFFIINLIEELLEINLTEANLEIVSHIFNLGLEFIKRQQKNRFHLLWPHYCMFLYNTFLSKVNDALTNTFKQSLETFTKLKGILFNIACSCLFKACLQHINEASSKEYYQSTEIYMKESLKVFDELSIEMLDEHIIWVNGIVINLEALTSHPEDEIKLWKFIIMTAEKFLKILETKNLDHKDVPQVCEHFQDIMTNALLRISYFTYENIPEITKMMLDMHTKYVSSPVTKKLRAEDRILHVYLSFIASLQEWFTTSDKQEKPDGNNLALLLLENFSSFLIMIGNVNLVMSYKFVQSISLKFNIQNWSESSNKNIIKLFDLLNVCYKRLQQSAEQELHVSYFESLSVVYLNALRHNNEKADIASIWLKYLGYCIDIFLISLKRLYTSLNETIIISFRSKLELMKSFNLLHWIPEGSNETVVEEIVQNFGSQLELWNKTLDLVESKSIEFANELKKIANEITPPTANVLKQFTVISLYAAQKKKINQNEIQACHFY